MAETSLLLIFKLEPAKSPASDPVAVIVAVAVSPILSTPEEGLKLTEAILGELASIAAVFAATLVKGGSLYWPTESTKTIETGIVPEARSVSPSLTV